MFGKCISQIHSRLKQTVCGTVKFLYHAIVITIIGFYVINALTSKNTPTSHISKNLEAYEAANGDEVNILRHGGLNNAVEGQEVHSLMLKKSLEAIFYVIHCCW